MANKEDENGGGQRVPARRESAMMGLAVSCKSIANEVEKEFLAKDIKVKFTDRSIARAGQLVSETVMQHVKDAFRFANHAKRQIPDASDIKLLYRRNSSIKQRIEGILSAFDTTNSDGVHAIQIPANYSAEIQSFMLESIPSKNDTAETTFHEDCEESQEGLIVERETTNLEQKDPTTHTSNKLNKSARSSKSARVSIKNIQPSVKNKELTPNQASVLNENNVPQRNEPEISGKFPQKPAKSSIPPVKNHDIPPKKSKILPIGDSFYNEAEDTEWAKQLLIKRAPKTKVEKEVDQEGEPEKAPIVQESSTKLKAGQQTPKTRIPFSRVKRTQNSFVDSFYNEQDDAELAKLLAPTTKKATEECGEKTYQPSTGKLVAIDQNNAEPVSSNLPQIQLNKEQFIKKSPLTSISSAPPNVNHPPTPILPGDWFQPESHSTPLNTSIYQKVPNETLNLSIDITPRRLSQTPKFYRAETEIVAKTPRLSGLYRPQRKK